jgi:hypothetical protein
VSGHWNTVGPFQRGYIAPRAPENAAINAAPEADIKPDIGTVRDLVWRGSEEWGWFTADAAFGRWYHITRDPYESEPPIVLRSDWCGGPERRYANFEDAKAGIQKMFEAGILECLVPSP